MDTKIHRNKELSIGEALIPVAALIVMLGFNVYVYGDEALSGSNQFVLLLGAAVAAIVGFFNKVTYHKMMEEVAENIKSTVGAILILLMVGALAGTWLISGIIPSMIYYGLQILSPAIFLPATVIICSIISIATGSSWTTSATVGIALIGVGGALGFDLGMVAGAVISGAYFGDKLSPMSDTTNLAPAMAGTDLFTHIRYMTLTTIPTYVITLILFIVLGLSVDIKGDVNIAALLTDIEASFTISPWLFAVPVIVIGLIIKKTEPLNCLINRNLISGNLCYTISTPYYKSNCRSGAHDFPICLQRSYGCHNGTGGHPYRESNTGCSFYFRRNAKNARHNLVDSLRYGFWRYYGCYWCFSQNKSCVIEISTYHFRTIRFYCWKLFSVKHYCF